MKRQWMIILALLLIILIATFAVLNTDPVPVNFAFAVVSWPLVMVILVSLLIGALIAVLISMSTLLKERKEVKRMKKEVSSFETDKQAAVAKVQKEHETELSNKNRQIQELKNQLHQTTKS